MVELLNSLKLDKYIPLFVDEDIGMRALMLLTDDDLKSLGVKMGGRRVILDYTQKEKEREEKEREERSKETGTERRRGGSANGSPNWHARSNSGIKDAPRLSTSARSLGALVSKRARDSPQRKSMGSGMAELTLIKSASGPTDDDDTGGEDCNFEEVDAPEEREEDEAELRYVNLSLCVPACVHC
jgi:hypothetical protein